MYRNSTVIAFVRLVTNTHVITSRSCHGAGSRCVCFRRNAPSNLWSVGLRDPTFRRNTTSKSRIVTQRDHAPWHERDVITWVFVTSPFVMFDCLWINSRLSFFHITLKSGYKNWYKILKALSTEMRGTPAAELPSHIKNRKHNFTETVSTLINANNQELEYRLRNYVKIVTVRHPLIRFLLFYIGMVESDRNTDLDLFARMNGRKRYADAPGSSVRAVGFPKFAEYVVRNMSPQGIGREADAPWMPQDIQSRPCQHGYDFVIKMETFVDDLDYLKQIFKFQESTLTDLENTANKTTIESYYQELSDDVFKRLCDFFRLDFRIYGYYRPSSKDEVGLIFNDFIWCIIMLIESALNYAMW